MSEKIEISLHDGKMIVEKLSSAIAYLEIGDTAGSLSQLRNLETWMSVKFVLIDSFDSEKFKKG